MKMKDTRKHWITRIHPAVLDDQELYKLSDDQMDLVAEKFHELGDLLSPTTDRNVDHIQRPDVPHGTYRWKFFDPQWVREFRGIMFIIVAGPPDEEGQRGVLSLIGWFARETAYDEQLTERLEELGLLYNEDEDNQGG